MGKSKKASGKKSGDKFSGFDGVVDSSRTKAEDIKKGENIPKEDIPKAVESENTVEKTKESEKKIEAPKVDVEIPFDVKLTVDPPKAGAKTVNVKFLKKCPRLFVINGYVEGEEDESKYIKEEQAIILRRQKFIA